MDEPMAPGADAPSPEAAPQGADVVNAVGEGLQALSQSPDVPDEIKQGFMALLEQYGQLIAAMQGGGAPEASGPQPEAAGSNPNVRPMGPQG